MFSEFLKNVFEFYKFPILSDEKDWTSGKLSEIQVPGIDRLFVSFVSATNWYCRA